MCELYPALAKAYEQFKLIYKMTEQDYKGKLKERGIDDDIPFQVYGNDWKTQSNYR